MDWLTKRLLSFKYAFQGLFTLFSTQPNAIIHLFVAVVAILFGFYFHITQQEWLVIVVAITLVLMAEAFNTSIEFLTDLASPDYHPLAKKAKDVAATAVLLTAIGAAISGLIIFLPYVKEWLFMFVE